jgi:hypothetical protein
VRNWKISVHSNVDHKTILLQLLKFQAVEILLFQIQVVDRQNTVSWLLDTNKDIAFLKFCFFGSRESKLTCLLQDSLDDRTKTSIIATISPAACNLRRHLVLWIMLAEQRT